MSAAGPAAAARQAGRGFALPAALVVLGMLGLLLAGSQRAALLQWRSAGLEAARAQAREDAHAAAAAASRWLLARGHAEAAGDCTNTAPRAGAPMVCSGEPAPWPRAWRRGIDGCRHACGFQIQALPALDGADADGRRSWKGFRIHAHGAGAVHATLRVDVQVLRNASGVPRLRQLAWQARP
jgi:type II secretory pathway pseudopilin PulG